MEPAAIGFRSRTGRAIAVVLSGSAQKPAFVWRGEIALVEPELLEIGPYHTVMELPWKEALIAVRQLEESIEATARAAVARLMEDARGKALAVRAIGVVGSSPRPLERIGNPHIRAHAAEGILFRRVLELAAATHGLPCAAFAEEEVPPAERLVKELGRAAGPPWRADERLAASAALHALRGK